MLLDMQSVRTILLELPSIGTAFRRPAPANYTKFVTKGMAKADMLLKVRARLLDCIAALLCIPQCQPSWSLARCS